ncbi:aminotransferase class I/II-fold pyridoxal phosphate-dependent enzyme [Balneolaceae bacterium ANBcel3]|nr:aminotransferase class I/II-fold pyridoxal phosphate-dependent enzyme [Balneolaceae bacterium ANBcel3]
MIPETYIHSLEQLLPELKEKLDPSVALLPKNSLYPEIPEGELKDQLSHLMEKLEDHYPFHHPLYAGQMLKPPHPVAWLAYALAMTINPNNHALDGGPGASVLEKEVIQEFLRFTGYPQTGLGHLTASGTIANLEALWVARELHPDKPIAISGLAHYTHQRMCSLLRHPTISVPEKEDGLPDLSLLSKQEMLPGTIVVTLGTTGNGTLEPLHEICDWAEEYGVRVHVDAAYGGFYHLLSETGWIDSEPWADLPRTDSIVIDPHKHGLQPYGCGCVLFKDPAIGTFYKHDSPYTYFTSDELHLGEISIECSRAGASAVALWMTLKCFPLERIPGPALEGPITAQRMKTSFNDTTREGSLYRFGSLLGKCRLAAMTLFEGLNASADFEPVIRPDLDIVTFIPVTEDKTYSMVSLRTREILHKGMQSKDNRLYMSTLNVHKKQAEKWCPGLKADRDSVDVLRMVLMKPEHDAFAGELLHRLEGLAKS